MKNFTGAAAAALMLTGLSLSASGAWAMDASKGEARYEMTCVNCHGNAGQGMASFPSLKGRDASYISERLTSYRGREKVGPNSALMYSWAADLSDDDIANLAAFISTDFQ